MTSLPALATGAAVTLLILGVALGTVRMRARARRELDRTRRELTRQLEELTSLRDLGFEMSESLEVEHIARRIATYVQRVFRAEGTMVALSHAGGSSVRVVAAEGSLARLVGTTIPEAKAGAITEAMGRQRLVLTGEHRASIEVDAGEPPSISAVAPLHAHGETLGAVAIAAPPRGDRLPTASDERLLEMATAHAALVLANATLFERLREGKEQWEIAFDALTEGIAVLDDGHRIRRVNRAMTDLLGPPDATAAGTHLCEALFAGGSQLHELLAEMPEDGRRKVVTARSRPLERTLRVTAAPLRSGAGGGIVVLIEDVTEWHALQSRLIQNERMVAVGQLVSGVAHELNNPLTSIAGLSEFLLSKSKRRSKDHEHLHVIREQAARAKTIVGNLLAFARKGPAAITEVDLSELAQRVSRLLGPELKLRDIFLQTELTDHLPPVRGDEHQIQQVVINLLTNAVQAAEHNRPQAAPQVGLATALEGDVVVLRVSDSGSGIPPEALPNLFTPFFTTKEPGKGTGLGLSISFGIAQGHGGTIGVESTGAHGTVFRVEFPVAREAPADAAAARPARESSGFSTTPLWSAAVSGKILLVDADPAVRRMIKALFSDAGQELDEVSTGAEALELLEARADQYSLIVIEARTAVTSGETLADRLVRDWPQVRSRTILITADVRPETTDWITGLGCRHFLKPFNVRDFLAVVDEIFGAHPTE